VPVLVSPSLDEARDELARGLEGRRLIVMVASCAVTYSGRTGSQLGEGERLIVVKGDGCVLVHRGRDYQPVNWQPAGCVIQAFLEAGSLMVKAVRPSPLESLNVRVNRVDFLGTFRLLDEAEFLLHASEEDMQRAILLEPDIIEAGLKVVDFEKKVAPGFVDVYAVDKAGNTVVIEIKKDPAGFPAVKQLAEYLKHLQPAPGRSLRPIIVAPALAKGVQSQLAKMGIEFRQVSLQKCVEIIEKHSPSDQQALRGWL
jgi:RecB family endonuclease NucS